MSIEFTSSLEKPSNITALPNRFARPAFGALYGFDAGPPSAPTPTIDGVLLTEPLGEPLVTEPAGDPIAFEPA